jgi:hypothetical protein
MGELLGYTALQRRIAAISGPNATLNIMRLIGTAAVREQKLLVRRKTGNTGRSIHLAEVTPTTALTVAGGAAIYLEHGTKAHTITPKVASVLAWAGGQSGGTFRRLTGSARKGVSSANMSFAMIVHHPGTKPYPFMLPGAIAGVEQAGVEPIVSAWNGAGL